MSGGWAFYALGVPAAQGSKRHVGHGVMIESSKALPGWRDTVTSAAFGAGPKLEGPVMVSLVFSLPRPKSARKADLVPWKKPDIEKLARGVYDSITTAGGWNDDAQVVEHGRLAKVYAGPDYDPEALPVPGVIMAAAELGIRAETAYELCAVLRRAHRQAWNVYERSA